MLQLRAWDGVGRRADGGCGSSATLTSPPEHRRRAVARLGGLLAGPSPISANETASRIEHA
jgi:hypothetical protein